MSYQYNLEVQKHNTQQIIDMCTEKLSKNTLSIHACDNWEKILIEANENILRLDETIKIFEYEGFDI